MFDLEEEFKKFLELMFSNLREEYYNRRYSKEEAEQLQKMLEDKLGMKDPLGELPDEGWQRSSWCAY